MMKKEYAEPRKTEIVNEIDEIKIDVESMIPKETVLVVVSNEGYIKRVPSKSYNGSAGETLLKPGDYVKNIYETSTLNNLVAFTNLGNYLFIPVYKIYEAKWKELGKHISNLVPLQEGEYVISSFILRDEDALTIFTKQGMIKQVLMKDLIVQRCSKPLVAMKLKDDDEVVSVKISSEDVVMVTSNGYYLRFKNNEVPVVGPKASGVKGMNLTDDSIISGECINDSYEYLDIFTNNNTAKRIKLSELKYLTRAKKGTQLIKKTKTVTYKIVNSYITNSKDIIIIKKDSELTEIKNSDIAIMDLQSTGSSITKGYVDEYILKTNIIKCDFKKEEPIKEEKAEVKEKQVSFEDFTKDFKL